MYAKFWLKPVQYAKSVGYNGKELSEIRNLIIENVDIFKRKWVNTSVPKTTHAMATVVWFDSDMMHVRLLDGREISVPVEWFPRLRNATEDQKKKWRLIGKGVGIHWEDIDEDISVSALLEA